MRNRSLVTLERDVGSAYSRPTNKIEKFVYMSLKNFLNITTTLKIYIFPGLSSSGEGFKVYFNSVNALGTEL